MRLLIVFAIGLFCFSCSQARQSLPGACPLPQYENDKRVNCGYLEVPENRNDPDSRSIQIAYLVFKARSKSPKADPVVFLQGGPGGATMVQADYWRDSPLREDRDFILIDQRGTGFSSAVCDDFGYTMLEILAENFTPEQEREAFLNAANACKVQMDEVGVDRAGYNTIQNAQDLDDLRKALGYEQLNLLGGSYGARLALAYMRDFPEQSRTSLLSALFPPQVNLYDNFISTFNRSLKGVFDLCEADSQCAAKYPDLRATFYEVLEELKTEPHTFSWGGEPFVINAQDLLMLTHQMLYTSSDISQLPAFIMAMKKKDERIIERAVQPLAGRMGIVNMAMNWSFNAFDEMTFTEPDALVKDLERNAKLKPGPAFFMSDPEILANWHPHRAPAYVNEPVRSAVPTFLANGSLDPVTPPAYAKETLKYLENAWYVEFPNEGHVVYGPCYFSMVKDFMDNPNQKPKDGCSQRVPGIDWR